MVDFEMRRTSSILIICLTLVMDIECQGKSAHIGDFPYQVSIRNRDDENRHIGGGAIIKPLLILTSASAVYFVKCPKSVYVVAGSLYLNFSGTFIIIRKCTIHPSFEYGKIVNDIALIHTATNIVFNEIIRPVKLPSVESLNMLIERKIKVNATGWGRFNAQTDFFC